MLLSVVLPVYNEAAVLESFHTRLVGAVAAVAGPEDSWEALYVDDGSSDQSVAVIHGLAQQDDHIRLVALARNFGKEIATTAGIHQAAGDAIVMMDSDGQHPPESIGEFLDAWREGAQVVIGVRTDNQSAPLVKSMASRAFYAISRSLSQGHLLRNSTDYCLIDQEVATAFRGYGQQSRMTRAIIQSMGYAQGRVEFAADPRMAGQASYSTRKLVSLALDALVTGSSKPLMWSAVLGGFLALVGFLAGCAVLVEQLILGDPLGWNFTGSAMLGILVLFVTGLILGSQGVIGLYLSAVYREVLRKPLYLVNAARSLGYRP
ncbi:MAG: glycosyltransferase family 2 protein [Bifidobacteriaceae bacterium]|nr:glycosyltransferase family 2 protein [Bifidobacteriaceae bacterium]